MKHVVLAGSIIAQGKGPRPVMAVLRSPAFLQYVLFSTAGNLIWWGRDDAHSSKAKIRTCADLVPHPSPILRTRLEIRSGCAMDVAPTT